MRKDIDFNFVPHPLTGDLATKKSSAAIKQALKNIVLTNFYERGFNIEFGTNWRASLFEVFGPLDAQVMRDNIKKAIQNFEPSVELTNIYVEQNENTLDAVIYYTEHNNAEEQSLTIVLDRIR